MKSGAMQSKVNPSEIMHDRNWQLQLVNFGLAQMNVNINEKSKTV